MNLLSAYSNGYAEARTRFRDCADEQGARREQYPVIGAEGLTLDAAFIGSEKPDWTVIVSSGLHGIEGFFGSAVQLAWLSGSKPGSMRDRGVGRVVLVHAVNPYGFSRLRRTDENNVDLNRNFLCASADFNGSPPGYERLDKLLNPPFAPMSFDLFYAKALWHILRNGLPVLKRCVAGGQYEFPRGLFFGGIQLSRSTRIVQENIERWIAGADNVLHIDLHSGLGAYGTCKLLLYDTPARSRIGWYENVFGKKLIELVNDGNGTAYTAKGTMGEWLAGKFRHLDYRFVTAEFGAHSILRVVSALRSENRAFHYCPPTEPFYQNAKRELMECFCPKDPRWRERVVKDALRIIDLAMEAAPFR